MQLVCIKKRIALTALEEKFWLQFYWLRCKKKQLNLDV
jgi:hypothetical protein